MVLSTCLFRLLEAKTHFLRSQAFGNVSKRAFSKKIRFEMHRIEPKRADKFKELLQVQKHF